MLCMSVSCFAAIFFSLHILCIYIILGGTDMYIFFVVLYSAFKIVIMGCILSFPLSPSTLPPLPPLPPLFSFSFVFLSSHSFSCYFIFLLLPHLSALSRYKWHTINYISLSFNMYVQESKHVHCPLNFLLLLENPCFLHGVNPSFTFIMSLGKY